MSVPYTVVGGGRRDKFRKYPYRLTILVLTRGGRLFRAELLRELEALGLGEIVWMEGPEVSHDLEISDEFPDVRFLLVREEASLGAMIDIGISESQAPYVLCMWSDMRIGEVSPSILEAAEAAQAVCVVPVIKAQNNSLTVPSYQSPFMKKGKLVLHFRPPSREGEKVLFPFDYCGIYQKELFARLGGYDPEIANPYWQKLDFGFRCHLWGEKIVGTMKCSFLSTAQAPVEEATPDHSYKSFYLKNLAVKFRREMGMLPLGRIFEYAALSGSGPVYAVREFRRVRDWVFVNRSRFRRDPRELIEKWGSA